MSYLFIDQRSFSFPGRSIIPAIWKLPENLQRQSCKKMYKII